MIRSVLKNARAKTMKIAPNAVPPTTVTHWSLSMPILVAENVAQPEYKNCAATNARILKENSQMNVK